VDNLIEQSNEDWVSTPDVNLPKVRKPNVTFTETDKSSVRPCGMDFSTLEQRVLEKGMGDLVASGRRCGKSITAVIHQATLLNNKYQMLYHYGPRKTPELTYVALNTAFNNLSKNRLPRGVARKIAKIERAQSVKVKEDLRVLEFLTERRKQFMLQKPICICGSNQVELLSVSEHGSWKCRSCLSRWRTTITARLVVERPAYEIIDEVQKWLI